MIETLHAIVAIPAVTQGASATLALLQGGGGYGPWGTIIGLLRSLIVAAGGLGIVVGLAVKSMAMGNSERQELGNRVMERAVVGLLIGLLAGPIYNLIVSWTS